MSSGRGSAVVDACLHAYCSQRLARSQIWPDRCVKRCVWNEASQGALGFPVNALHADLLPARGADRAAEKARRHRRQQRRHAQEALLQLAGGVTPQKEGA